jgi:hypothetical protein
MLPPICPRVSFSFTSLSTKGSLSKYKDICGGMSPQNVEKAGNADLRALLNAKTREDYSIKRRHRVPKILSLLTMTYMQRSFQFFIDFCAFMARSLVADTLTFTSPSPSDRSQPLRMDMKLFLAILIVSNTFFEFSWSDDGFGNLGCVGALANQPRDYFFGHLIQANITDLIATARGYHPGVTPKDIRLFYRRDSPPNVLSFFHLVYQSPTLDHVYSFSIITNSNLNQQTAIAS